MSNLSPEQFRGWVTLYSAQTSLVTFFVLAGLMLMIFAEPPLKWLAGGAPYSGNWLATIAAGVLLVGYGVVLSVPWLRAFFDLVPLPLNFNLVILGATLLWALAQQVVWRNRWFEKLLDVEV